MNISMKSVRLFTFGGEYKHFQVWCMRFTASGAVYGFDVIIRKTRYPCLLSGKDSVIDLDNTECKKQEKSKNMNAITITNLTVAFASEYLIGMVYQARITDQPSGLAHMLLDVIFKKYVPQDLISKIKLLRALNTVIMKKEEDPANLFEAIIGINNKYNTSIYQFPEEEKTATVTENAPAEYSTALTCE